MTNKCVKELAGFVNTFQILPRHFSAIGCHLQGVIGALEATHVISVLWARTDYDPFGVASCRGHDKHLNLLLSGISFKMLPFPDKTNSLFRNSVM
jgi:hypothetical protein